MGPGIARNLLKAGQPMPALAMQLYQLALARDMADKNLSSIIEALR